METIKELFGNQEFRARVYQACLALVVLAALYGLIGEDEVAGWTALVTALLGNGMAVTVGRIRR